MTGCSYVSAYMCSVISRITRCLFVVVMDRLGSSMFGQCWSGCCVWRPSNCYISLRNWL